MIAHFYDELLHIVRVPPHIVRNADLEQQARDVKRELVEVCA